jgi:lysozyme
VKRKPRWPVVAGGIAIAVAFVVGYALLFGGEKEVEQVATPSCHTGPVTPGIDVSYYQETIDWRKVRKSGVLFAFIRVSDGSTFADPMFEKNWSKARPTGILRGAYQYFRPEENAVTQADILIAAIKRDPGELPPVIDVESTGGRSPAQIKRAVETWIKRVREKLGVEPIIYTGPDFWKTEVKNADLTSQPLWIAHYTTSCPQVPAPWKMWTFWQYTDKGQVPGIIGNVDMNVFAGSFTELEDFARRSRRPL